MPAPVKHYRVKVRVVRYDAPAFDVRNVDAHASNAHDARKIAERKVAADHPDARAVVAIDQRRARSEV
jgi:hypothetical protein